MRPVRFVALSEDGQALVLADEVGRLLALPVDDRLTTVLGDGDRPATSPPGPSLPAAALSPRDIQARIRGGESADEVARIAGVPVDRVLRYAGPVLQERAMLAQHARRTRLTSSESGASLADVVDAKLAQHGVEAEKISWDAYRREDGGWRIIAAWPSGKATAQAMWDLDRGRSQVTPYDDMAQYLCAERPTPILGQDDTGPDRDRERDREQRLRRPSRPKVREVSRGGGHGLPTPTEEVSPPRRTGGRDPIRTGRDALLASLDRPLGAAGRGLDSPGAAAAIPEPPPRSRGRSPFEEDPDTPKEVPAVPSLAVLRPRRAGGKDPDGERTRRGQGPSWDEVLFGTPPAARES